MYQKSSTTEKILPHCMQRVNTCLADSRKNLFQQCYISAEKCIKGTNNIMSHFTGADSEELYVWRGFSLQWKI